jgi:UPF0755 protein
MSVRSRLAWFGIVLGLLVLAAASAALGLRHYLQTPAASTPLSLQVPAGASLRSVLARLAAAGELKHPQWLEWYVRLHEPPLRVQMGRYEFAPAASPLAILERLRAGPELEQLTIIEGWNFDQMRAAINADANLTHEFHLLSDTQLMGALGHPEERPEGRFFPDTYRFAAGTSERRVYELAYARMAQELNTAWTDRAPDLPLATPTEALTLASIVEKETGSDDERSKVAAVFVNRLRQGMRLQSDPTVIYGLGERYDGSVHKVDLLTDTPYNTYTRTGLPPTPIALPGAAALHAVLHPDASDALYFVATGLGDGHHQFSATLEQHNQAVNRYLQRMGISTAKASGPHKP